MISATLSALTAAVPTYVDHSDKYVATSEAVMFYLLAPLILIAALGLLFAKKAVHAAMCMVFIMISLSVFYASQGAQFLFAAQIVVYTGAIMMLFLFVLMLIGVDTEESLKETLKGQRVVTTIAGLGLLTLIVGALMGIGSSFLGMKSIPPIDAVGLANANQDTNPVGVARILFSNHFVALELVGTLLVSAALGAILMTHKERLVPARTQRVQQAERTKAGKFLAGLPAPGVFARHNSTDTPALLPDGTPASASVSRVLKARGQTRSAAGLSDPMHEKAQELELEKPEDNK